MRSLIVTTYKRLQQADLGVFTNNVISKMTADSQFSGLSLAVQALKLCYDAFQEAVSKADNGGKLDTMLKNVKKEEMMNQLDNVARQVDVLANEDVFVILAAGFEVRKAPVPLTTLPAPTGLVGSDGERTGEALVKWSAVPNAAIYAIERRKKGETAWQNGTYSTAASIILKGIEPDTRLEVRISVKGTKEISSDYSQIIEILVS